MRINKLYICYSITTLLISVFVYSLIYSNMQNMKKLERLREEVDDIAQMMLQTPQQGKSEPKYLTELIDNFIKKRLAGIWDDLYSIKKQLKGRDCAASIAAAIKSSPKNDGSVAQAEERVNYASEDMGGQSNRC
ncbi:hypothetical protein DOY81_014844 [Sarcophaga bullata]|nr:hypothetical protein DOY81_014844 [Sarcophaga bullata]